MKVEHIRSANVHPNPYRAYCISHIYVDGKYFCDAIEDWDRGLDESMSEEEVAKRKVAGKTAIPTGRYTVKMGVVSPTFSKKPYYMAYCGGKLPRLDPVKGFSGILIHRGVDESSSAGCVIVGYNKKVGCVTDSQKAWEGLYQLFKQAARKNEKIEYIITRKFKV